jgi:hypothetical protein
MRQLLVTALMALGSMGVFSVSLDGAGAAAAPRVLDREAPLFVTSVKPARNQETLPDLSDPGLNTRIEVRFSTYPRARDLVDDPSFPSGLSRKVAFLDQAFAPVHAMASVRRNFLFIDPFDLQHQLLRQGRYTLTIKPSVRSWGGKALNEGRGSFTTRFSVGSWRLPFVLVRVSPRDGQTDVGLRRTVVASFDRPVDPLTAFESVRLEDRSTQPPTPIDALVTLEREGLDVVVVPGSPGYAAGAEIALVISGRGTATQGTVLATEDGVEFTRDWGPRWTADADVPTFFHSELGDFDDVTGEFTMTFRTKDAR